MRLLPLLAVACSGAVSPGTPRSVADVDEDGWTPLDGDCDDSEPTVHPDAVDIPGDGVDSDCADGDAETLAARGLTPGDLVITELQKRPIGVDAALGEWLELHNRSGHPVDLFGLQLRNEGADVARIDTSVVVESDAHVVLGLVADPLLNGEVAVDHALGSGFRVANTVGSIEVFHRGVIVDSVAWDATFPDEDGRTMQRDPNAEDATVPASWCPGVLVYGIGGYGTPGALNTPCQTADGADALVTADEGDLIITEIMKDPLAVDGSVGEWVEFFNASGRDLDLQGLELVDEDGEGIQLDVPARLNAGEYALFAASDDPDLNGGLPGVLAGWGTAFSLRNSEDTVTLRLGTREFDTVEYDNGETFPDPTGASLALDPAGTDETNDEGASWCVSEVTYGDGDFGTPGEPNAPCPVIP